MTCFVVKRINLFVIVCLLVFSAAAQSKKIILVLQDEAAPRMKFGAGKLRAALQEKGYSVATANSNEPTGNTRTIVIGEIDNPLVRRFADKWKIHFAAKPGKEGYIISNAANGNLLVAGTDPSGVLYGCLELTDQVKHAGRLLQVISMTDQPEMVLRGACIGIQKPYYLPGRTVYEYPYTPQTFPWLYDKKLWIQYLDSMVANRMNSLYLWNGHPFASLVRLKDYPYAVEVDDNTFKKNEEIYRFLTTEADKRGIWVIQMFYNIIVSKPFAEKNHIKTQDRERPIIPLIADYTRKSIAAFVEKYPNVGLMVCLGEAMEGVGNDDIEWFTKTIIPGVQDGLKSLHKKEEPPIVLRAHDTDAPSVMKAALPLYKNLYTEAKFNGEALTTPRPRGSWAALHQTLGHLGSVQIENVHIMANLEPFRYGAVDFIQQSVKGMHEVMGGNGLHLYPQASYWDWPYSADSVQGKKILQIERDWIWYTAWSRYAWKANRDTMAEAIYWSSLLSDKYGADIETGKNILEAYEQAGEIAPKLLRRFGITDGNRQTLSLGMFMTQLINPYRYGLFSLLYESESPEGEMLGQYAEKEWRGEKHIGETPVLVIGEVKLHADRAVDAVNRAARLVQKNKDEFLRLKNDVYCDYYLAYHYALKAEAALQILRYKYSNSLVDLEKALPLLKESLAYYDSLVVYTKASYRYANSMQTQQRKIPVRGADGKYTTWAEMYPLYKKELAHFEQAVDSLKKKPATSLQEAAALENAAVHVESQARLYTIDSTAKVFSDTSFYISAVAKELKGLQGLTTNFKQQVQEGSTLIFTSEKPVQVLVGFFSGKDPAFSKTAVYLKAPELETNASANEYGQAETKIANAIVVTGMPPVNIHAYRFPAGRHTLKLAKGACMIVGFINAEQPMPMYDAGLTENGTQREIDWLFE
jgi:tetratricopeptide (TPR) repeat protein